LIIERLAGKRGLWGFLPVPFKIALTFVAVMVGWVFFRAESMGDAIEVISSLSGIVSEEGTRRLIFVRPIHLVAGIAGLALVWFAPTTQSLIQRLPRWWVVILQLFFLWTLAHLHYEDHVPFLYFQF